MAQRSHSVHILPDERKHLKPMEKLGLEAPSDHYPLVIIHLLHRDSRTQEPMFVFEKTTGMIPK